MLEQASLIDSLQQKFFETHNSQYLRDLNDACDVVMWLEELYDNDYTENAC